jgi:hypothetical protein
MNIRLIKAAFLIAAFALQTVLSTQITGTYASAPPVYIGLSESASALNYGNTINFTVTPPDGGTPPFAFTWYIDGQVAQGPQASDPQHFSVNSLPVGAHHAYVEVEDANGNVNTTNNVEFDILTTTSSSPLPSSSPTNQPTASPHPTSDKTQENLLIPIAIAALGAAAFVVGSTFYYTKYGKVKQ